MLICWIEDNQTIIDTFMLNLNESSYQSEFTICHFISFEEALNKIKNYYPSILILDIREDSSEEYKGVEIFQDIISHSFCPLIIHSAIPKDNFDEQLEEHKLVEYVTKGTDSEKRLLEKLVEMKEKLDFMETLKRNIKNINHTLLKDIYPHLDSTGILKNLEVTEKSRLFGRRLAASLDFTFHREGEKHLNPWEMYIYPPLPGVSLLTGDIIKKINGDKFLMVLSPSCDMVTSHGRKPKINKVLTAHLELADEFIKNNDEFKNVKRKDIKKLIKKHRKKEPEGGQILLPRLNDELPGFCVELKKLSLIPIKDINPHDNEDKKIYKRIASIDSPFRENISNLISKDFGRLGLPDLDLEKWAEAFWKVKETNKEDEKK